MKRRNGIHLLAALAALAVVAMPIVGLAHQVAAHSDHLQSAGHPCDLCLQLQGNPAGQTDAGPSIEVHIARFTEITVLVDLVSQPVLTPCGRAPPGTTSIT